MTPVAQRGAVILRRLPNNGAMAEIGVLLAKLSEHVLSKSGASMVLVDSWAPASEQPDHYKATNDDHSKHDKRRADAHKREALSRVARFGKRVKVLAVPSAEAAAKVDDGSLDLVFIDADHSYEGVKADIAAWLPKVKEGGWIGGHDYRNPDPRFRFGVDRAVDEWAAASGAAIETDLNFTWFARV